MRDILLLILLIPTDTSIVIADRYETVAECEAGGEAWLYALPDYRSAAFRCAHLSGAPVATPRPRPRGESR